MKYILALAFAVIAASLSAPPTAAQNRVPASAEVVSQKALLVKLLGS